MTSYSSATIQDHYPNFELYKKGSALKICIYDATIKYDSFYELYQSYLKKETLQKLTWVTLKVAQWHMNTRFDVINGVLFTIDHKTLVLFPPAYDATSYKIPNGVEHIAPGAFMMSQNLRSIEFPDSLKTIGAYAFAHSSVITTGELVFELPPHVQSIGAGAFEHSRIEHIKINEGVTEIPDAEEKNSGVFEGACKLVTAMLPESLKIIGSKAFKNCNQLKIITFPSELEEIHDEAFNAERLNSDWFMSLPESLKYVGSKSLTHWSDFTVEEGAARGLPLAIIDCETKYKKSAPPSLVELTVFSKNKNAARIYFSEVRKAHTNLLCRVWKNQHLDMDTYRKYFMKYKDITVQCQASLIMLTIPEMHDTCFNCLFKNCLEIALPLLNPNHEQELIELIQQPWYDPQKLYPLLEKANEINMTTASAYILSQLGSVPRESHKFEL